MQTLAVAFAGDPREPSWDEAYLGACAHAEAHADVRVKHVGFDQPASLYIRALRSRDSRRRQHREEMLEDAARQRLSPETSLGISPCGDEATVAADRLTELLGWAPGQGRRWITGTADDLELGKLLSRWILVIIELNWAIGRRYPTTGTEPERVLADELAALYERPSWLRRIP